MPEDPSPVGVFRILFVCTGNLCRSPLAERLGQAYLDELLGDDAASVQLVSAGTDAVDGERMHPFSALVLRGIGGNPDDFSARRLAGVHVEDADLVLTMTREHRGAALSVAPRALAKTFTLREATDLARALDLSVPPHGENFVRRARSLVEKMASARARRQSTAADDITDPMGRSVEIHQQVGEAIADALLPLLDRIVALREALSGMGDGVDDAPHSIDVPPSDVPAAERTSMERPAVERPQPIDALSRDRQAPRRSLLRRLAESW